jgi:ABC-type spermidine/putrescine transport system permease subunit I
VIGGLTYNFLPFMLLPIYVSLEKIDTRLVDAASTSTRRSGATFRKVILPLSLPGVFAGTLLTFIPATGRLHQRHAARQPAERRSSATSCRPSSSTATTTRRRRAISFVLMAIITVLC